MKQTTPEELANDAFVTSPGDVTVASFKPLQLHQQVAVGVDSGNNVDEVMTGISDSEKDIHG